MVIGLFSPFYEDLNRSVIFAFKVLTIRDDAPRLMIGAFAVPLGRNYAISRVRWFDNMAAAASKEVLIGM
jgi:hypothetical protein